MDYLQHQPSSPPSSPLSMLSQSPSLPPTPLVMDASKRYPSPTASALTSGSASPLKSSDMSDTPDEIQVRGDGPPTKRRRLAAPPKARTTAYVDLERPTADNQEHLDRLMCALRKKKRIVVIAGAGISVSAGIPDFRSSTGLFTTLRGQHNIKASGKHLFDASVYKQDSSTTAFHAMVSELAHLTSKASPTPFHHMLASLAQEGRLMRLYTQNIDSIDTQMPPLSTAVPLNTKGPWPTTIQLHGGLEKMVCTKCGQLEPFDASLFDGPEPPLCEKCKEQDQVRTTFAGKRSHGIGRLRPRIVLYNEYNPDDEAIGNVTKADMRRVPDALIVVGTSLKIPGVKRIVKEMCQLTRSRRDGITAWLNIDPEPQGIEFKDCWDLVVRGKCDDIAELVSLPRWDQQEIGDRDSYMVSGDEKKEQRFETSVHRNRVDVLIERKRKRTTPEGEDTAPQAKPAQTPTSAKSKLADQLEQGILTPIASPRLRNPLPVGRPPKGRPRQSTLGFSNIGGSKAKETAPAPAPARRQPATQRKPRQAKKAPAKPREKAIRLDQTFKATKVTASNDTKASTEKLILTLNPSPTSSSQNLPNHFKPVLPALPALRPAEKLQAFVAGKEDVAESSSELSFMSSSPPSTPTLGHSTLLAISPSSKPRNLTHLLN
ncbi:DHS-like NAD/FAD-binding domain-containing protein [Podospora didyma]|uniref:DHS-like NAD/FAD-binding domain-containing protein n=1 Tax=Podospora didyma TaxID=330526 RepID=A0AAE0KAL3_9PEZI|nr:DHS-like NAD/FAD-binding domain-containing protein [Podospora didyma]